MTDQVQENQVQEEKVSNKELNFRRLEAQYEQKLAVERALREEAEKRAQQVNQREEVEEDNSEPYVDDKRLDKKLNKFGQATQSQIEKAMQQAKASAKEELKQEMWLENNRDFYDVLNHAEKFAQHSPHLAESILRMPEGFERQKLVYQNIKALGLDKPEQRVPSVQEKIDSNKRSPYYQPTAVGASPYASSSDFSPNGQKQAYDKMKELQARLRM